MKSLVSTAFLVFLLAISAIAQTQPATVKIVFMNTDAFYDEKLGITKLINATKQLNNEFAAQIKALEDGGIKLQGIVKEIENMQKLPSAQFNQTAFNTKQEEGEKIQRELQYKKTELETALNKRRVALISPVSKDIGSAITKFFQEERLWSGF